MMEDKFLFLEPYGGLANRMRVISSALKIYQLTGLKIRCIWVENNELNCPFNKLFEEIDGISLIKKPSYMIFLNKIRKRSFSHITKEILSSSFRY